MSTATLDEFMALNDELAALSSAGVPLGVEVGPPGSDVATSLERINALVARRVSQGASLAQAIEQEEEALTPSYRSLVLIGLRSGDLQAALRTSTPIAESIADSWHVLRLSLLYPLIVACLAYVGFVALCLFFVPVLETLYADMQLPPGRALQILWWMRTNLLYWALLPPIALVLLLAWLVWTSTGGTQRKSRSAGLLSRLPGVGRALRQQRCAVFAEALSELLEQGTSLPTALRLAADACGEPAWSGSETVATSEHAAPLEHLPPFLRWAIWSAEEVTDRPRALRMAARLYRDSARRGRDRWSALAPILTIAVLGGGVTLLYGLSLFIPVVEMLRSLAH